MDDLKIIKKKYGENMMHLCRKLFPTLLEEEGLLSNILLSHFEPSKFLYNDITENHLITSFATYIYSFLDEEKELVKVDKSPEELLKECGYILYQCKNESDIQSFKKYYSENEELCTFIGGRLDTNYVFFAVKENANELRRKNFLYPKRQDEYGTSVISIQFTKDDNHTLSIKNRYNHSVSNPDATFSNNLDNIIEGLTKSFEEYYGMKQKNIHKNFEIPGYVFANDNKYYKYNYEINNIYYCPNNIIIDNFNPIKLDEKYLLIDYFIIDIKNKTVKLYDKRINDSFTKLFNDIKNIQIENNELGKIVIINFNNFNNVVIKTNKTNNITSYYDEITKYVDNNFLSNVKDIKYVNMPKLIKTGDNFIKSSSIENIDIYNLEYAGKSFLKNSILTTLYLPNIKFVDDEFLMNNKNLKYLNLGKIEEINNDILFCNRELKQFIAPSLKIINAWFLPHNTELEELYLPSLLYINSPFLTDNKKLNYIYIPNVKEIKNFFLKENIELKEFNAPYLETVGNEFLMCNTKLEVFNAPNLYDVGIYFLDSVICLREINAPKLNNNWFNFNISKGAK